MSSSDKTDLETLSGLNSSDISLSSGNSHNINDPHLYRQHDKSHKDHESIHRINTLDSGRFSVEQLFPHESLLEILLRRERSVTTILTTLSHRVNSSNLDVEENMVQEVEGKYDPEVFPDSGSLPTKGFGQEFVDIDPELVTWDGEDDPLFPRNWPVPKKWALTILVSLYTLLCGMGATCLSPGIPVLAEQFGVTNDLEKAMMSSIFILGWAISPLVLAPLSEMYGRKVVLNTCIWILLVFNITTACAKTYVQMVCLRFVAGLFALAPLTIGGGVLGDLFDEDHRNLAMGIYAISPNVGPIISPIISSWIVSVGWRWCIWWMCIVNGVIAIVGLLCFRETYTPTLLRRKAARLRKESGNEYLRTVYDVADGETTLGKFYVNIARPMQLLFTHPMVIGLGAFMAFSMGLFFILSSTYVALFESRYGYSVGISGLMWIPLGISNSLGLVFWTWLSNKVYFRKKALNGGVGKPEFRLPVLILAGIMMPMGLVLYGWTLYYKVLWIAPAIGAAIFAFTLVPVFQVIQNYFIDMSPRFAASSLAAAATYRCVFGFLFPLFGKQLYLRLDYGWGNTMLAFLALLLGVPFPFMLVKYGETLRLRANRVLERRQDKRDAKNLRRLQKLNGDI